MATFQELSKKIKAGDVAAVTGMLKDNPDLATETNASGNTALILAVKSNKCTPELVLAITSIPACDILACDADGKNALHWAVIKGRGTDIIETLLGEKGVDATAVDKEGKTALTYAMESTKPNAKALIPLLEAQPAATEDQTLYALLSQAVALKGQEQYDTLSKICLTAGDSPDLSTLAIKDTPFITHLSTLLSNSKPRHAEKPTLNITLNLLIILFEHDTKGQLLKKIPDIEAASDQADMIKKLIAICNHQPQYLHLALKLICKLCTQEVNLNKIIQPELLGITIPAIARALTEPCCKPNLADISEYTATLYLTIAKRCPLLTLRSFAIIPGALLTLTEALRSPSKEVSLTSLHTAATLVGNLQQHLISDFGKPHAEDHLITALDTFLGLGNISSNTLKAIISHILEINDHAQLAAKILLDLSVNPKVLDYIGIITRAGNIMKALINKRKEEGGEVDMAYLTLHEKITSHLLATTPTGGAFKMFEKPMPKHGGCTPQVTGNLNL